MEEERRVKRRRTPPLTSHWLREQAHAYLQRYPASEQRLRQILWKRVRRAQTFHGGTDEDATLLVESVIKQFLSDGRLNDDRFALDWARTLQKRGTSRRLIGKKLREKGLNTAPIETALSQLFSEEQDWETEAARKYAQRRRLGPFRAVPDNSWERRQKDLASMARAGFGFDLAKRILET
jgi:regulatory protein